MEAKASTGGLGLMGVLAVAFIVLKLVGVISWSWWWVLAPLWAGFALWMLLMCVVLLIAITVGLSNKRSGGW